jgi:archaellum component FlaC
MTIEKIEERIKALNREAEVLTARHDRVVRDYQQVISGNQNRFQQIKGAVQELEYMKTQLNGSEPTP